MCRTFCAIVYARVYSKEVSSWYQLCPALEHPPKEAFLVPSAIVHGAMSPVFGASNPPRTSTQSYSKEFLSNNRTAKSFF